jgi:hypothetical protein
LSNFYCFIYQRSKTSRTTFIYPYKNKKKKKINIKIKQRKIAKYQSEFKVAFNRKIIQTGAATKTNHHVKNKTKKKNKIKIKKMQTNKINENK